MQYKTIFKMTQVYEIIKSIGVGSYGQVYLARIKASKQECVIKKIRMQDKTPEEKQKIQNQVKLLQQFKHVNIVKYLDSFIDREGALNIVMNNCQGGDMYQLIQKRRGQKIPQKQIIDWAVQVALAIYYMHEKRILHRDLKTSNIFLNQGRVRLGDFGISKVLQQNQNFLAQTNIGTPLYMSPQQFRQKPYSYKSDIWAFGCVLYQMCNQKHAFNAQSLPSLARKIFMGEYAPVTQYYSSHLRDLIHKMLSQDPKKRPTIIQLLQKPILKKRVQSYINEILSESDLEQQMRQNLVNQVGKIGIVIQSQNSKVQRSTSQTPRKRGSSWNQRMENIQKKKKQLEIAKEKLREQLRKQNQEQNNIKKQIKEAQRKKQVKKMSNQKSKTRQRSVEKKEKTVQKKERQKIASAKNTNSSFNIKKQSKLTEADSNRSKWKQQAQEIKRQLQQLPILDRQPSKPFKMEEEYDMHHESQSEGNEQNKYEDDFEVMQQQPCEKEIKASKNKQQEKTTKQQTREVDNILKQSSKQQLKQPMLTQQNFHNKEQQAKKILVLQKQLKQRTQKINLLRTELQSLENCDLEFSSDSENEAASKKENPTHMRLRERINDLKLKITGLIGKQKYGDFMVYLYNHYGKNKTKMNKQELGTIIGTQRVGLWHIGQQIVLLQTVLEGVPKIG